MPRFAAPHAGVHSALASWRVPAIGLCIACSGVASPAESAAGVIRVELALLELLRMFSTLTGPANAVFLSRLVFFLGLGVPACALSLASDAKALKTFGRQQMHGDAGIGSEALHEGVRFHLPC